MTNKKTKVVKEKPIEVSKVVKEKSIPDFTDDIKTIYSTITGLSDRISAIENTVSRIKIRMGL